MATCRCLVIGDPHFKVTEMMASQEMASAIVKIAQELNPDFIVCLGDTLDRHETIHTDPLTAAVEWLRQLCTIAKTYLLIGNHDRPNNSDFLSDKHPFVALKWWGNQLVVVDKVVVACERGYPFFFVPYVPPGKFQEALATNPEWSLEGYKEMPWKAGFSHQEFYGIKLSGDIFSEKGDSWPLDYPLLINGHIHDRDIPQPNIISVGTPRQHRFGESFNKGISLFIFTPEGWSEEIFALPIPKKIVELLTANQFYYWEIPEGLVDQLKLEISGTRAEIIALRKLDKFNQAQDRGIKIVTHDIEAGNRNRKEKPTPLPPDQWQQSTFRQRLALRAREEAIVEQVYRRLFTTGKPRFILIKTKK